MAPLPLPSVTPIDVTAARLDDVDRRAEAEKTAFRPAEQVKAAVHGAEAGIQVFDALDQRKKASFFQQVLDAGAPARLEFWAESGSPAHMDPNQWVNPSAPVDQQQQQAVSWYREMVSYNEGEKQKAGRKNLVTTLSDPNAEPGKVAADAAEAGASTGEILTFAGKAAEAKAKAKKEKDEQPAKDLDLEYKRLRNAGQKALNDARRAKNQGLVEVIGHDLKELKSLRTKAKTLSGKLDAIPKDDITQEAARRSLTTQLGKVDSEISKISGRIASYSRDLPPDQVKSMREDDDDGADENEPPSNWPEARRAKDGRWYVPDPDRAGKYLDVTDNPEEI